MAGKQTVKRTTKPQKTISGADESPKLQRGASGRFVSNKELTVELRAAREPAVQIDEEVALRAAFGKPFAAPVGGAARPPRDWVGRVLAWFRKPEVRAEKAEMEAQMAAVKAGVLHELESIGARKGVALKGSPFASVVLPVRKRKPYKRWAAWAAVGVAAVAIMVWVAGRKDMPEETLGQLGHALATRDVGAFEKLVDVEAVSTDLVNQMFALSPDDVLAVRTVLLLKPGMVAGLQHDLLAVVRGEGGRAESLPLRLKVLLGGDALDVGRARIVLQDENMAVAEVPLMRADLALTLPLQVVMEQMHGRWVVVRVPNFTKVVSAVLQAEAAQAVRRAAAEAAAVTRATRLADMGPSQAAVVRLAKPATDGRVMTVNATVHNTTERALDESVLRLEFGDAIQRPLLTLYLPLQGQLAAQEAREMVWQVPVDANDARARDIAKLPLEALSVTATVVY